jgi:signal transduction histidine kinase
VSEQGRETEGVRERALTAVSEALVGAATDLSLDTVLERLVHTARELVDAEYAALGIPDGDGGFTHFITAGMSDELIESLGPMPRTHGLLGAMLDQPTPYRSADIRSDPRFYGWWPKGHPDMRSFLGYPILFKGSVIGAFYLTNKRGAPVFGETDEELVGIFAPHAAVLVEYARLYEQSRELSIAEERNRMARELHDALSQTLFGTRLAIKTATLALTTENQTEADGEAPATGDTATDATEVADVAEVDVAAALEQLGRATALVNEAFAELRALIMDLTPPNLAADRLAGAVRKQLDLLRRTSGLTVDVDIDDEAEASGPDAERQLFRIVQEAVANVVRHADAKRLHVSISRKDDEGSRGLVLEVRDDGIGFDPDQQAIRSRRLGLTSMVDRARSLGGTLTIESSPGDGTAIRVEVPCARG